MMGEGNGLCTLQMRIARHNGFRMLLCLFAQHCQQLLQLVTYRTYLITAIHTGIQCHLIITGACCVQSLSRIPDALGQLLLHEHMNILRCGINRKRAAFDVTSDVV